MGRNYAIDFVKGVGLFLIAALHITIFGQFHEPSNWVVNTSMRFVVPFFFLTSGYLLFKKLQKSENKQKIFQRYVLRVLKYYLAGFTLCYAFDYFVMAPLWEMPSVFFRGFVSGSFWSDFLYYGMLHVSGFHLWFLIAMFWAGIVIFLACRKDIKKIKQVAFIALGIHLIGLFGMTQPYSQFFVVPIFPRDGLFFGLFYMSLGGLWAVDGINVKKYVPSQYMGWAILLCFVLQLVERSVLVFGMKTPVGQFWGEYFITTIPLTILLFQYALDNGDKFKHNVFTKVGEKSIGVYIFHAIAINITYIVLAEINRDLYQNPFVQVGQVFVIIAMAYAFHLVYLKLGAWMRKFKKIEPKSDILPPL